MSTTTPVTTITMTFPNHPSQSFIPCAKGAVFITASVRKAANCLQRNCGDIWSGLGILLTETSLNKSSQRICWTPTYTDFSVIKTGKQNKLAARGSTESGNARGGTRGRGQRQAQAWASLQDYHQSPQHHEFPSLPPNYCSYLAWCISRNYRHDCSIYCKTVSDLYSVVEYYFVTDRCGLPIELWEEETFRATSVQDFIPPTHFRLKWRHSAYTPTYSTGTCHPKPPTGGGGGSTMTIPIHLHLTTPCLRPVIPGRLPTINKDITPSEWACIKDHQAAHITPKQSKHDYPQVEPDTTPSWYQYTDSNIGSWH